MAASGYREQVGESGFRCQLEARSHAVVMLEEEICRPE
jgi:hypothetical protein